MSQETMSGAQALVKAYVVPLAWKLLGALAVWIVGGWVIRLLVSGLGRGLALRRVDPTLASYLQTSAGVLLRVRVH